MAPPAAMLLALPMRETLSAEHNNLGVMLLDLENPARIIARGGLPGLWPESPYEMLGRVANVTFTCNAIPEPDGTVKIYYGAADTCVGLATARLDDLVAACKTGNPTAERFFKSR